MAKCALCGKSGLFFKVDANGFCPSCAEVIKDKQKREEEIRLKRQREKEIVDQIPLYEIVPNTEGRKRNKGYPNPEFSNITPKGKYYDFVVFDTETTGLSPSSDRIIELAAIRYREGFPVEVFHTYINPQRDIPASATAVNKITNENVSAAPTIGEIIGAFDDFVGDGIVVAHNLDFDLKFVFYSGSQIIADKRKFIDTLEQARRFVKKADISDYQLGTLCDYFKITIANQHSALYDAFATGKLFLRLVFECQGTMPSDIFNSLQ